MDIFEKWDSNTDLKGLQEDIVKAGENGDREFEEIPHGNYEVKLDKDGYHMISPICGIKKDDTNQLIYKTDS